MPDHGKAIHVEDNQSSFVEFGGDRVRGNKCNAETGDHGLLDGFVAAHGEADLGTNAGAFEQLLHQAACSRSRLARQESFACKLAWRDAGFSRHAMSRRRDDDMGVIADQVNVHVDVCRRAAHDRKVEIVTAQRRADLLPVADRERDVDVRVPLRKSGYHERYEVFRGADGPDRYTACGFARHHLHRGFAIRDRKLDPVGQRKHFASGIRQ